MNKIYIGIVSLFCLGFFIWNVSAIGEGTSSSSPSAKHSDATSATSTTPADRTMKPFPVITVKAKIAPIALNYEGTGSIEASKTAVLASPAEGPVLMIKVREGDTATSGETILKIGRTKTSEALLSSALEDLKNEEEEVHRVSLLVQNGALAGEKLSLAKANLQKARAQSAKTTENLEDFGLKAPWTGVISKVLVSEGNFVAPRVPLVEMYDPESLVLRFSVPENLSAQIKTGMSVTFHLDAHADITITGAVSRVYPELDRKTRTLTIEAITKEDLALLPGMFARLKLIILEKKTSLIVPSDAVKQSPKGYSVIFTVHEGKAKSNRVRTGMETREYVEILEGVSEGEQIIVQGHDKLKDGAAVMPLGSKPESPNSEAMKGQQS